MDYENYTFESLGFSGISSMIKPRKPDRNTYYNTITMPRLDSSVESFLTQQLLEYLERSNINLIPGDFYAGITYFMDGTVLMVFNGIGNDYDSIISQVFEPDYYKSAKKQHGVTVKDSIDFIAKLVNSRGPNALAIIQEIPSPEKGKYHFRIVHNSDSDVNNIIKFPGAH